MVSDKISGILLVHKKEGEKYILLVQQRKTNELCYIHKKHHSESIQNFRDFGFHDEITFKIGDIIETVKKEDFAKWRSDNKIIQSTIKGHEDAYYKYVESGDVGGKWSIPKGHVEEGEEYIDAAKREFREETGFDVPDGKLTPFKKGKVIFYVLEVDTMEYEKKYETDYEIVQSKWFKISELPDLNRTGRDLISNKHFAKI